MKKKEITLYDSYYSIEKERQTRQFLFEVYGDEESWKSPEDIPQQRVFDEMDFQDGETWRDVKDGGMYAMTLDRNLNPVSDAKLLFRASEAPWTKGFDGGNYVTDGPFLWRLESGKLAMLWSSNGHKGYAMGMSLSDSVEGPWTHLPEPLVKNDGGHGMIFRNKGKIYITYHYPNNPNGAERPRIVEVTETDSQYLTIKK